MDYYCGKRLTLNNVYQFVVQFEPGNIVVPDYACNVTFTESNDMELRMAVRVVHYESVYGCSQRLVLHDFSSQKDYIICSNLDEYKHPGNHYIYQTWANSLRFNYIYGSIYPLASFKVVVTLFHEGHCGGDEVRCSNGICIKQSIYCNRHNPCGNGSDSCGDKLTSKPNSATNIVLSVLIPVGLLAIIGASVYVYCCRNRRCRNISGSESQTPRFWFNAFTSRENTEPDGVTNQGANFDDPPDYNSLHQPPPTSTTETPPAYNEVIKDTVKYKVNDNTHDVICYV